MPLMTNGKVVPRASAILRAEGLVRRLKVLRRNELSQGVEKV